MKTNTIQRINKLLEEDMMTDAKWMTLWEATKEPLRLLMLAVVSWLLTELSGASGEYIPVLVVVLRFFDKWLHEVGKREDNALMTKGITRF